MTPAPIAHRPMPVVFGRAAAPPLAPAVRASACPHGSGSRDQCSLCRGAAPTRVAITPKPAPAHQTARISADARSRERECEECDEPFVVPTQARTPEALTLCKTCRGRVEQRARAERRDRIRNRPAKPRVRSAEVPRELAAAPDDVINGTVAACRADGCPIEELHAAH